MEKTARKPSADPIQEKLRQNKANWNKDVSAFVNNLIHLKKMMNGWPSKFFKERSRITDPIPADPATIIGSLAGDFQELAQRGNALVQEQIDYSKNRRKRQPKQLNLPLQQPEQSPQAPEAPKPPTPDLSKQLSLGLNASSENTKLFKLASEMEEKYFLESQASNPFTRFIARLFNPKFGFGEAARMRRLRMTMLDGCAKTFKTLKELQATVVKSSDASIEQSHKMMTMAWNNWNIVYRLVSAFKGLKPGDIKESGGAIEDPELKRQRAIEEGRDPDESTESPAIPSSQIVSTLASKIKDFRGNATFIGATVSNPQFRNMVSLMERLAAMPKGKNLSVDEIAEIEKNYNEALVATAKELGFSNMSSFSHIAQTMVTVANSPKKEAQELRGYLGKTRHQLIPGSTSGSRLEIYNLIGQTKKDIDALMDLLEKGFEREKIETLVGQIHRQMSALRTMIRSLLYSTKPEKASSPFF